MLIVYEGPIDAVEVPALGLIAERGVPVEVDTDLVDEAKKLLEQGCWSEVKPGKKTSKED